MSRVALVETLAGIFARHAELVHTLLSGQLEHGFAEDDLADAAQSARAELVVHRLLHDEVEGVGVELEGNAIEFEEALVLLDEGVFRLGEDAAERVGIERVEVGQDGEAADELGDEPKAPEVRRGDGRRPADVCVCLPLEFR